MESEVATAVAAGVTQVTGAFSTITGWWIVPVAVGFFVAGTAISLIIRFFGKRKRSRRK